jgi:SAM-dependent methyltransferase
MNRQEWLSERQADVIAVYDAEAPTYDRDPYPTSAQEQWISRMIELVPAGGTVLDAPCGTGKYFPMIAAAGLSVAGVDQSAGMLAQARARRIARSVNLIRLQELHYAEQFDAVLTVDAMENVPPEDWPVVVANLRRAVRPGGVLYMTVEHVEQWQIEAAFSGLRSRGLPAVRGEVTEGDVAGYHFYPGRDRAAGWLTGEGLEFIDEGFDDHGDWGYYHFLLRRPA